MTELSWPPGLTEKLANEHITELEREQLEYLMSEMYYWREKAEKCACAQCTMKGDITHRAYWEEHQRVRQTPGMDQEEERLYFYALSRIEESLERKKEIEKRNGKKKK
jgi:hypothetical protein